MIQAQPDLRQIIQMLLEQARMKQMASGFSLAPKPGPNEFSLAEQKTSSLLGGGKAGKKKVNYEDMLVGAAAALASVAGMFQEPKGFAPAVSLGQKYPVQPQFPFGQRASFRSLLGGGK